MGFDQLLTQISRSMLQKKLENVLETAAWLQITWSLHSIPTKGSDCQKSQRATLTLQARSSAVVDWKRDTLPLSGGGCTAIPMKPEKKFAPRWSPSCIARRGAEIDTRESYGCLHDERLKNLDISQSSFPLSRTKMVGRCLRTPSKSWKWHPRTPACDSPELMLLRWIPLVLLCGKVHRDSWVLPRHQSSLQWQIAKSISRIYHFQGGKEDTGRS